MTAPTSSASAVRDPFWSPSPGDVTSPATARYLARDLGPRKVRVNLVSAGPLGTLAARGIPGFGDLATAWQQQAPLGWDTDDPKPVAGAILFLLSDLARGVTGEILHVDGGFHAMGTAIPT